uniref:Putative triabin-like lipocalin lipocalin n=1 Tax=Panstrongylus lignarius TaxID=156445 RepID=A0A224XWR4_9HEMI
MNLTFLSLFILLGMITLSTSRRLEIQSRPELNQRNITQELQKVIVGCLDLPPKQKFNISSYFRSVWFLDRFYVLNFPSKYNIKSLCSRITYDFTLLAPFQYIDHRGVELDENGSEILYTTKSTNYITIRSFVGKFSLCDAKKGELNRNCHTDVTVLDTDYDNYSIEYICGREGFIDSASIIKIHTRQSYILDDKVTNSLKKFGLKLEDFKLSMDQLDSEMCDLYSTNSV